MPSKVKPNQQSPYSIPSPPDLDPESLKRLDLWNALEFFRVEALLRSESARNLYWLAMQKQRQSDCPGDRLERWRLLSKHVFRRKDETALNVSGLLIDNSLREDLFIDDGWLVLWGAHHRYVRQDPWMEPVERSRFEIGDGVVDLSLLAQEGILDERSLLHNLHQDQKLNVYLKINCAIAPERTLKTLRPFLHKRHRAVKINEGKPNIDPSTGEHTFPWHPRKKPSIRDYAAWLRYFQCYDLRACLGLNPDEIATKVYANDQSSGSVDVVNKALSRIAKLIAAAEANAWPPANLQ